jgi:hypothetical protein
MDFNIVRKSALLQIALILVITAFLYVIVTLYYSYKSDPYRYDFFPSQSTDENSLLPSFLNPFTYVTFNQSGLRMNGNSLDGSQQIKVLPGISKNESGGMEFTISMFLYIDRYYNAAQTNVLDNSKALENKAVILKKGDPNHYGTENSCPAIVVGPQDNTITVFLNTFVDPEYKITINNLPIKKWFSLALVVQGKKVNIYVNGFVKKSVVVNSPIRQNFYPITFGSKYGGFNGELTSGAYYRYALSSYEIRNLVKSGPNMTYATGPTQISTPYYKNTWWTENRV